MRRGWVMAGLFAAALVTTGVAAQGPAPEAQEPAPGAQEPEASAQQPAPGAEASADRAGQPADSAEQAADGAEQPDGADEPGAGAEQSAADAEQSAADGELAAADTDSDEVPYKVECGVDPEEGGNVCQVDRDTYVGWRTFHSVCHTCHAQDAVGSSFAPALLPRVRMMDKAHFVMVVDQGFTGQVGVMPAWGENPNVNKYYDELWAYLRARADGVLPPGRPKRLPDDN